MIASRQRVLPVTLGLLLLSGLAAPSAAPSTAPSTATSTATSTAAGAAAAGPSAAGPNVVLDGSGWGHSVGMSQYGARAMAEAGHDAGQILRHYYPGVSLRSDVGPGEGAEVAVDLFRNRSITDAPGRLLLQAQGREGGAAGDPLAVGVRTAGGDIPLRPVAAPYNISFQSGAYVLRDRNGVELARTATPMSTYVNPPAGTNPALLALPQLGATLAAGNRRGTFQWGSVTATWDGTRIVPVLRQPMGLYLRGIAEVPSSWHPQALRAQALTARTYAARRTGSVLSATPADQAYAGWEKEGEPTYGVRWVQAVDGTSGLKVVAPDGALAQTFYSSSHGLGRSESSEDSWAYSTAFSYLRSVPDPWSSDPWAGNPYASWTAQASNPGFAALLGLARVNSLRVLSRTAGGSPRAVSVDGWTATGVRTTCTWSGGAVCPANEAGAKGAGATLRTSLPLVVGGAPNGRLRSQQIAGLTLAPFTDDEDSVHQFNIGVVADRGIARGCTPTTFCPRSAVTRGQMAAFLARALGLPAYAGQDRFSDVAGSPQRAEINALAAAGRIGGYPDGTYRPGEAVTRAQMATFLARAFDVAAAGGADRFDDIATDSHRSRINDVAAVGLTGGCSASSYCPSARVTREQMASFLARAVGGGA